MDFTDDCQLIEYFGKKVKTVVGSYDNIKKLVAEEISEKILYGMREAFSGPIPNKK